ncbi:hypothetical protein [Legionella genomosp. 1]|uniref:hypothetical protein n=1 Tax=Legionella genomosp. 1 TaxID=1093625 RepID=UPI0010549C02|nr:hypothetical protein [Legionella genomosp. 1]
MKNFLIITGLLASVYALPTCWAKEANPCDVQYPIASTVSQLIVVEPVGGVKAKLFLCEKSAFGSLKIRVLYRRCLASPVLLNLV